MAEVKRIAGPSPEAIARLDRLTLALYDAGEPLTTREAIDRLSDPMSRGDANSAFRRMRGGAELVGIVEDSVPRRYALTARGRGNAERLIAAGGSY